MPLIIGRCIFCKQHGSYDSLEAFRQHGVSCADEFIRERDPNSNAIIDEIKEIRRILNEWTRFFADIENTKPIQELMKRFDERRDELEQIIITRINLYQHISDIIKTLHELSSTFPVETRPEKIEQIIEIALRHLATLIDQMDILHFNWLWHEEEIRINLSKKLNICLLKYWIVLLWNNQRSFQVNFVGCGNGQILPIYVDKKKH